MVLDKPIIGLILLARVKLTMLSKVLKLKDKTEKKTHLSISQHKTKNKSLR